MWFGVFVLTAAIVLGLALIALVLQPAMNGGR